MDRPSIDHGILSPSGKVSKRSRKIALERVRQELFGDGLQPPAIAQPSEKERKVRMAAEFRELAARGMSPRKFTRLAEQLEKEIQELN